MTPRDLVKKDIHIISKDNLLDNYLDKHCVVAYINGKEMARVACFIKTKEVDKLIPYSFDSDHGGNVCVFARIIGFPQTGLDYWVGRFRMSDVKIINQKAWDKYLSEIALEAL